MKKILYFFLFVFVLSGCTKIKHLDQLLLIKNLSDEQIAIDAFVKSQDMGFNRIIESIEQGSFDEYQTKEQIYQAFGEPIVDEQVVNDQQELEVWLYRAPTHYFNVEKVYVYFDAAGLIVDWTYQKNDVECLKRAPQAEGDLPQVMMCPLGGHFIKEGE